MKLLLAFFFSVAFGNFVHAEASSNVLLVFSKIEMRSMTGQPLLGGIELSASLYPDLKSRVNFVKIIPDKDVKSVGEATENAIKTYKPIAIIGGITSNGAFVISDLAEKYKIPFITPYATSPEITKNKKYVFRACFDDIYQADRLAQFARTDLKRKRALLIINRFNSYSLGLEKLFEQKFREKGGEISDVISIESEKDINDQILEKVKHDMPDVVFIPSYQIEAAAILSRLLSVLPHSVDYIGPDSWVGGPLFHNFFNKSANNAFNGYYVQHLSNENIARAPKFFRSAVKKLTEEKYSVTASEASLAAPVAIGYDAGRIFFEALRLKLEGAAPTVEDAIPKVSFKGITGEISFAEGHTPHKPLYIYSINNVGEKFFKEIR